MHSDRVQTNNHTDRQTSFSTICVSSMLAEKLNMTPEEAEKWIVNMIRNSPLDAKIDSKLVSLIEIY